MFRLIFCLMWTSVLLVNAINVDECANDLEVELNVEQGWPVAINCNDVMGMIEYEVIGESSTIDIQCDVIDGSSDVIHSYNSTYILGSSKKREVSEYVINKVVTSLVFTVVMTIEGGRCWATQFYIDPFNSTSENGGSIVQNGVGKLQENGGIQDEECKMAEKMWTTVEINRSCAEEYLELNCEVPYLKLPIYSQNYQVTWYRDCVPLDRSYYNNSNAARGRNHFSRIQLPRAEQYPGVYTCKVALLGSDKQRFLVHYKVCFTMSETQTVPDIKTEKLTTYVTSDDITTESDVTIACSGHVNPNASPSKLAINWYRHNGTTNESICILTQTEGGSNSSFVKPNFVCTETSNITKVEKLCDSKSRSCEKFNRYSGTFRTTLTIRGVTSSDMTSYYCQAMNLVGSSEAKVEVELKQTTLNLDDLRNILIIVLGSIFFVFIFGVICWRCFKIKIKLLKKKYLERYDADDKEYTLFISYSFKRGITCEENRFILKKIQDWLSTNSYTVYDHYQKGAGELRFSEVERVLPRCHRMMFFVTSDFIKDQDNLFDAQTGMMNYIKNSTKLIFVLVPSVKKELKEKLMSGQAINVVMKQRGNSVIKWRKERQFFDELRVAMPKLRNNPNQVYIKGNSIATNNNSFSAVV